MNRLTSKAKSIRYDLVAGVTVALVALPQALAYAELAGMPPHTGLYALAASAIAAAFFASSPHLQVGPVVTTSLLTLGVLGAAAPIGSEAYLGAAAVLALIVGVTRVSIGAFRLGALAHLLAQPVMMGFVSAAALLILVSQLPAALGISPDEGGLVSRAAAALLNPGSWDLKAIALATITIIVVLLGKKLHPAFPGALFALLLGIACSALLDYGSPTVGEMPGGFSVPSFALPFEILPSLIVGGVVIAILGFSEAASIARTYAILDRRRWSANREFVSQGAANIAAGLFGGFPVGASFTRSALNRISGARTRWSGLLTGIFVVMIIPFMDVLSLLPMATLAGILIASVLGLLRLKELFGLRAYSKPQAYIGWATFALTLLFAPRIDYAVLIGIGLAVAHHLRREQQVLVDVWLDDRTLNIRPRGVLWFGSAPLVEDALNEALERHEHAQELVLRLGSLGRIDLSAAMMLGRLMDDAREAGLTVRYVDVPPMAASWVKRVWSPQREEDGPASGHGEGATAGREGYRGDEEEAAGGAKSSDPTREGCDGSAASGDEKHRSYSDRPG